MTRAGIYGRQSKAKAKSIAEQLADCDADTAALGWTVAERYSDGKSASRHAKGARGDWARLLADLDAGRLDALVLWESSRGDRTLTTWSAMLDLCRERGVLIRITEHRRTYDVRNRRDWRTLAEDGVDSADESEKTSARSRRATAAQAAAGRPHGRVRYGYERVYDPATRALLGEREHPEQAAVVRFVVRQVGRSMPIVVVARWLAMLFVPAPGGGRWYASTVRAIASNPAYAGYRVHHSERYPATWQALVTEAEHLAALRVLTDPKRKTERPGRQVWMLSYLVRCAVCGEWLNHQAAGAHGYARYRCASRGHVHINARELDAFVLDVLAQWLAEQRLEPPSNDGEALAAHAEADALQVRLDEWRDSAARGETSPASLARIEPQLIEQIKAARQRAERASTPAVLLDVLDGLPSVDEIRRRLAGLPAPAQREIIGLLLTITIHRPTRRASRTNPIDFDRIEIQRR